MDPSNYRIHKKPQPSYRPRAIAPQPVPRTNRPTNSTSQRPMMRPVQQRPAARPNAAPVAPKPISTPALQPPRLQQQRPATYNSQPQMPNMQPQQSVKQPEYTLTTKEVSAPDKSKKHAKKRKWPKRLAISFAVLLLLAAAAGAGYYYYQKSNKPVEAKSSSNGVPATNASVDFTLYKTKDGSLFKSESYYTDGKQNSKVLVANSTKNNNQVVMTQQQVDKYFTTDPNGLDKLLQSVGENSAVTTNNGTSYIVKGGTTAITVRGETLIIIRSTTELKTDDWVNLFNSLESINKS